MPEYIKKKTKKLNDEQKELGRLKYQYQTRLEEELVTNMKHFNAVVQHIPEKYLTQVHKDQLVKNKDL